MTAGNTAGVFMREATVSAGLAGALLDFAVRSGAAEDLLLECAGIRADDLLDQDNRIPFASYVTLMRTAKELCGNPALALEYGAATDYRRFSVVGLIAHASATSSVC